MRFYAGRHALSEFGNDAVPFRRALADVREMGFAGVMMLWMEIPKYFYLKLMILRVKLDELIIKIRLVLSEQVLFLNVIENLTRVG